MACRLCLELGIDDPEAWLASKPRRVMNTWEAYWRLEPWGMPWHRHAAWMCKLDQIVQLMIKWATGGKTDYKMAKYEDWMPGDYVGEVKRRRKSNLRQQLRVIAKAFGGKW